MTYKRLSLFSLCVVGAAMLTIASCDDGASPEPPLSIRITQPADSSILPNAPIRILTETSNRCGCDAHVEFWIDGVFTASDYLAFYSYDWDPAGATGAHSIAARLVLRDGSTVQDSILVFISE
jgi:hypothetical protein